MTEPLDAVRLQAGLPAPWRVAVLADTESTNADLLAAAERGEPAGAVLAAEYQRGGRGRLNRTWTSPPGAGLTVSLLLRPAVETARWGWLPLLAGVALLDTVLGPSPKKDGWLKWPNDLLLGSAAQKAAGILVQTSGTAVVVGIGLNVTTSTADLPPGATSLLLQGQSTDRTDLLIELVAQVHRRYQDWQDCEGDSESSGLAAAYRARCSTVGRRVQVQLAGSQVTGWATGIDSAGRLQLNAENDGERHLTIAAGDVIHLRPA